MKVIILCGGMGTRLKEETEARPKPMVDVGPMPIVWHIMKGYAHHGFNEFLLALGYKGEFIKRFFVDYNLMSSNFMVRLGSGDVLRENLNKEDWVVHLVDTGLPTNTGGRMKRLADRIGKDTFMMTYGDGVSNVNLTELYRFHRKHGKLATVTAVHPPARFGELDIAGERDATRVRHFAEKPQVREGWINGGFFVLDPRVLDYIDDDDTSWQAEPMERLAKEGQLMAFCHEGFWQCMDTVRDLEFLQTLWRDGKAPWRVW